MAEEKQLKRNDDLVRLVNESAQVQRSNYDGSVYEVKNNDEIVVRRDIAEHLMRKTSSLTPTGRVYTLGIVELPVSQRQKSPGEFPKLSQEVSALQAENDGLKEEIKKLVKQNAELESEIKKLKRK